MEVRHIGPGKIPVPIRFADVIREETNRQEWIDLLDTLEASLLRRTVSTPDIDLPRLKGKVEYIGELRNFFAAFYE